MDNIYPYLEDININLKNELFTLDYNITDNIVTTQNILKYRIYKNISNTNSNIIYIAIILYNRSIEYVNNYLRFLLQVVDNSENIYNFVFIMDKELINILINSADKFDISSFNLQYYMRFNTLLEYFLLNSKENKTIEDQNQINYILENIQVNLKVNQVQNVIVDFYSSEKFIIKYNIDLMKGIGCKRAFINKLFSDNLEDENSKIMVLDDNITGISQFLKSCKLHIRSGNNCDPIGIDDIPILNLYKILSDQMETPNIQNKCLIIGCVKGYGLPDKCTGQLIPSISLYKLSIQKVKKIRYYYSIYFTRCSEDTLYNYQLNLNKNIYINCEYRLRYGHTDLVLNKDANDLLPKSDIFNENVGSVGLPYYYCIQYLNDFISKYNCSITTCNFSCNNQKLIDFKKNNMSKYKKYQYTLLFIYYYLYLNKSSICLNEKNIYTEILENDNMRKNFLIKYKKMSINQKIIFLEKLGFMAENNKNVNIVIKFISELPYVNIINYLNGFDVNQNIEETKNTRSKRKIDEISYSRKKQKTGGKTFKSVYQKYLHKKKYKKSNITKRFKIHSGS